MKDGLCNQCKDCIKEHYIKNKDKILSQKKEYALKNKEKISQKGKERYQNNKEFFKQQAKERRENNKNDEKKKEEIKKRQREYYNKNKEKLREYQNKWYEEHKEEYRKKHSDYYFKSKDKIKAYREKNKEHIKTWSRENQRQKMQNDEIYRFATRVRGCLNKSFKRKNATKSKHSEELLGCSVPFFQKHLYKTFYEKYGYEYDGIEKVHIDHIIPLATAKTVEDVEKLCHYTNLQLLRAEDNLKKGSKTDYEI